MARRKRQSPALALARHRFSGLKQIVPEPNLGPNITIPGFEAVIKATADIEQSHSQLTIQMDHSSNRFDEQEALMNDWNSRVLAAVAAQYGLDSSEYEMVGGTRTSDRKRSGKKSGSGSPSN